MMKLKGKDNLHFQMAILTQVISRMAKNVEKALT